MKTMPSIIDLFGEVPVTLADIELWLDHMPRMCGASAWRRDWYTKNWNVTEKIKRAKLGGAWPPKAA